MEKLFAYGSLKDQDIQESVFGRKLTGINDKLIGYTVKELHIEEEFGIAQYPIITATNNPNDSIEGIVYELTQKSYFLLINMKEYIINALRSNYILMKLYGFIPLKYNTKNFVLACKLPVLESFA